MKHFALSYPLAAFLVGLTGLVPAGPASRPAEFSFVDASEAVGLSGPLQGIMGHAAACGDIDGDGDVDLYVGNFCDRPAQEYVGRNGPVPNMLLLNQMGKYVVRNEPPTLAVAKRTSGAVFADLDNDGDLDLFISLNSNRSAAWQGPNRLFENLGQGQFKDVSEGNAACIVMGGRTIGVLDYDGDGLLDLLVNEDYWTGMRPRLFRNLGKLRFEDVAVAAGLPDKLPGLGLVTADFNDDGWPDLFVAQANQLLLSTGKGTYRTVDSTPFASKLSSRSGEYPCGASFADIDNDGDFDIITADHCDGARIHLFLNQGLKDGIPQFKEVSGPAGLGVPLPARHPGGRRLRYDLAEIQDFDNDGLPDILVGAVYEEGGKIKPLICRNLGIKDGLPRFSVPPLDKVVAHFPAAPTADFNRDGRMDIFLCSWFPDVPSRLFLNNTSAKNWLQVRVIGKTINRMGVGAKVKIFRPGQLGRSEHLLGYNEIHLSNGYCSGREAEVHFGLGEWTKVDVEIVLPAGKGRITRTEVAANQRLTVQE